MSFTATTNEETPSFELKILPDQAKEIQPKTNRADNLAKQAKTLRLAKAAQHGCIQSFEKLVGQFEKPLYRFLMSKTGNHHQAEDLLQDTFLTSYRKLYRFNPIYPFASWIFTIANRLAISQFRKQKPMQEECDIPTNTTPRCSVIARESNESLWKKARKILSENHYTAVWLYYAEGMTIEEVATTMNRKPNSIKVWLHRSRNRLATDLKTTRGSGRFSDA